MSEPETLALLLQAIMELRAEVRALAEVIAERDQQPPQIEEDVALFRYTVDAEGKVTVV